ncbi:MAG: transposase [Verrucomicrobia bacterium]|nr:transposase [Verrucomicrobiota bacterium]
MKAALSFSRPAAAVGPGGGVRRSCAALERHDRLTVIGAVELSPARSRIQVDGQVQRRNVQAEQVVRFVCEQAARYGRIVLGLDRSNPPRPAVRQLQAILHGRLQVEWLPAYAPDLNPAEPLWNHAKYADLANFVPDNLNHLGRRVGLSLYYQSRRPTLLRSFFKTAKLRL